MVDIYDPIEKLFKKRYESLSDETKHRLKKLDNICSSIYQPKLIKRKRPKLCRGDVFVMNLFEDIYFYGVVLNTGIDDSFMGRNLVSVCILKKYSKGMTEFLKVESLKTEDILIRPSIISRAYWSNGFFYNTGENINGSIDIDYGFYSNPEKAYVDEYGTKLESPPEIKNFFALTTMTGISSKMRYELIIDDSFMEEEDQDAFRRYIDEASSYVPPQKEPSEFDKSIAPFEFEKEHGRRYCVTLEDFEKLRYIFTWKDSDIEGNGYEWEEVMKLFVKDRFSDIRKRIKFDSEAGMFYMYCSDGDMLQEVISRFVEELKATGLKEYVEKIDFETL